MRFRTLSCWMCVRPPGALSPASLQRRPRSTVPAAGPSLCCHAQVNMPEMNGFELCYFLREVFSPYQLPIVVVTGHIVPGAAVQAPLLPAAHRAVRELCR